MRWGAEREEIEATIERIWDLHDDISEAILAVSKSRFLASLTGLSKSSCHKIHPAPETEVGGEEPVEAVEEAEAKSLSSIRTALENLEDQLEYFLTVHSQHRTEQDTAFVRLEQSRIILAKRLDEYNGKKYRVIEDALAFVGNVSDKRRFVSLEDVLNIPKAQLDEKLENCGRSSSMFMQMWFFSLDIIKKTIESGNKGGILGNGTVFAFSMLALLQLHRMACSSNMTQVYENSDYKQKNNNYAWTYSSPCRVSQRINFDVMSAKG